MPMMRATVQRGFTLVEMIVSLGLFAVVMLVATSAYYNLINLDRRARATNEIVNNLSFAMEAMMRGIRTGVGYTCNGGTPMGGGVTACTCFTYQDSNISQPVTYYVDATRGTIMRSENSASCTGGYAITDPLLTISTMQFYLRGDSSADNLQPQVLFTVKGSMPADSHGGLATFVIEENATQRVIDL